VRPGGKACKAQDGAAGVHVPVGRKEPRKGGHKVHPAVIRHRPGDGLRLGRRLDEAEAIAQPLDRGPRDGDGPLQRIGAGAIVQAIGHRGEQPAVGGHDLGAGVHQQEGAGAIGVLGLPGEKAGLAHQGALLVAQAAAHGNGVAKELGGRAAVGAAIAGGTDLGQHLPRDAQDAEQLLIPLARGDVHQERARGVSHVRHVHASVRATGEVPDQPGIDGPKEGIAALGIGAQPRHMVQQPLDLGPGKVDRDQEPGPLANQILQPIALQLLADLLGAHALPHDGIVVRAARVAIPDHRGLALIGDAQRHQVPRAHLCLCQRSFHGLLDGVPDLQRVMLDPAWLWQDLFMLLVRAAEIQALVIEQHAAGTRGALVDGRDDVFGHSLFSRGCRRLRPRA